MAAAATVAEARRAPGKIGGTRLVVPAKDLFDESLAGTERELATPGRIQHRRFPRIDPLSLDIARACGSTPFRWRLDGGCANRVRLARLPAEQDE